VIRHKAGARKRRAPPPLEISESQRIIAGSRLRALADAKGYDGDDLGRRLNIGIARATAMLHGAVPDDCEVPAILELVGVGG